MYPDNRLSDSRRFARWAKEHGGGFTLKRYNNTTIVISDQKLIKTLLDKKSNLNLHRPASLVSHLITQSDHLLVMQYGERWRMLRKNHSLILHGAPL
ncbi:hypothetical protein PDIG_86300 [Penicillium digitatum PHI26]|uniref:Cytochrome P450 n=2 Tax=Penicillium digitatum TaxID=36651 RepID=K9F6Y5_PEND2|nr:hypothetical protein PDIP_32320 [Penicillium digitatum Pd1]EKV04829.1 hypothetical protein PDIG_86300 [Penicillium digitatum PHI26]EKV17216.1 hypothetical protein PDIP_32320 [Penicillium digitatum Pd1]